MGYCLFYVLAIPTTPHVPPMQYFQDNGVDFKWWSLPQNNAVSSRTPRDKGAYCSSEEALDRPKF